MFYMIKFVRQKVGYIRFDYVYCFILSARNGISVFRKRDLFFQ